MSCVSNFITNIQDFFPSGSEFGVKVKEGSMMSCTSRVVVLVCLILTSYCAKEKSKENEQWKKKDIRDYSEADLERLYDQWEVRIELIRDQQGADPVLQFMFIYINSVLLKLAEKSQNCQHKITSIVDTQFVKIDIIYR